MTIISITIALLLFGLLGTALYKGIFRKNKINNPYTSQFEEVTTGTKPTMDGRNPIEQTKENVEQKTNFEEDMSERMQETKNVKLAQSTEVVEEKAYQMNEKAKETTIAENDVEVRDPDLPKATFDKGTIKPPVHHDEEEALEEEWNRESSSKSKDEN